MLNQFNRNKLSMVYILFPLRPANRFRAGAQHWTNTGPEDTREPVLMAPTTWLPVTRMTELKTWVMRRWKTESFK